MAPHKQVEVEIGDDFCIEVDEGLEDIIKNLLFMGPGNLQLLHRLQRINLDRILPLPGLGTVSTAGVTPSYSPGF